MFFGPVYAKPALGEIFRFASQVPHFQICFSGTPFSDLLLMYPISNLLLWFPYLLLRYLTSAQTQHSYSSRFTVLGVLVLVQVRVYLFACHYAGCVWKAQKADNE